MLTLLLGTDWKSNREYILQMLSRDVSAQKGGRIWMVPELVSHQTERDLAQYVGNASSRFAEVVSFSRLANRISDKTGSAMLECMDNGGRLVAMASTTRILHSKLKAYAQFETKPEFLLSLLDMVDEFKRYCITSADLLYASKQTQGTLAQKLEELSLILETYDTLTSRGKRDPRDQLFWVLDMLESSDFAKKHTFYFDGFSDFSVQQMDIVYHLLSNSAQVVLCLNCDAPGSRCLAYEKAGDTALEILSYVQRNQIPYEIKTVPANPSALSQVTDSLLQGTIVEGACAQCLQVVAAESNSDACTYTIERIVGLIQNGCRYRDISIVCADFQGMKNPVEAALNKAQIPYYLSGTDDILEMPVIHTVLSALDAALGGFRQKDMIRYLKSFLSPLPLSDSDRLENYALLWSVDGSKWLQNWDMHPRGLGEEWSSSDENTIKMLNEGRGKAVKPLEQLSQDFKNAIGVQQQVMALYSFLQNIRFDDRLRKLADSMDDQGKRREAQILNQLWEILLTALEQLYDAQKDTSWDSENFVRLLRLLLSQYDVGTIPSVLDAVTVGSFHAMRYQKTKHLFVLGASEGVFPSYGVTKGLLNDQERVQLKKIGIPVNSGALDELQTEFSLIAEVFANATESITVLCSDGHPSYIYTRLKRLAGGETIANAQLGAALRVPVEAASKLVSQKNRQDAQELGIEELYDFIDEKQHHSLGKIQREHILNLYGSKLRLSASQIDKLAECRLHYFLRYGLSAKERKPVKIDPAEFGTYVHAVLEECARAVLELGGFKNVSLEKTLEITTELSAKYFAERFSQMDSERLSYHFQKNTREVQMIVEELWSELQNSSFQAVDFELSFGDDGQMPAVDIPSKTFDAQLRGFVDRVDIWDNGTKPYVRVVDYKTGKKDFDYCDIYNGIGLQMLLYLYALQDGGAQRYGQTPSVAGVQYFPARVPLLSADGAMDEDEVSKARAKAFKRRGLLLSDKEVLYAMEPTDHPQRLNYTTKKDGTISGDLATASQFAVLKKYIYHLLEKIVDEIASGNVTPNPYTRGSTHNACAYCPYGQICHPDQVEGRRNYQAMSSERFWSEIERKEYTNG